ncbi:MAG TPA: TRL-like family protein [Planctomycetota bacterium]|nr:TRL-like family protein [Planctomycetota bacterium]
MRKVYTLAAALALTLLTSCISVATPAAGWIYTDVKWPQSSTSNSASTKVGTGEAMSILGIVATGDASIETAAKKAGITKIHHVDMHTMWILVYGKLTTTVYGE